MERLYTIWLPLAQAIAVTVGIVNLFPIEKFGITGNAEFPFYLLVMLITFGVAFSLREAFENKKKEGQLKERERQIDAKAQDEKDRLDAEKDSFEQYKKEAEKEIEEKKAELLGIEHNLHVITQSRMIVDAIENAFKCSKATIDILRLGNPLLPTYSGCTDMLKMVLARTGKEAVHIRMLVRTDSFLKAKWLLRCLQAAACKENIFIRDIRGKNRPAEYHFEDIIIIDKETVYILLINRNTLETSQCVVFQNEPLVAKKILDYNLMWQKYPSDSLIISTQEDSDIAHSVYESIRDFEERPIHQKQLALKAAVSERR